MTRDDIIKMANDVGIKGPAPARAGFKMYACPQRLLSFAALVAAAEREKVAAWMMGRGYATGHADSMEDLLQELDWQVQEPVARVCYTLTQTNVGIGERGMQAYEEAKKRGSVCESEGARGEQ